MAQHDPTSKTGSCQWGWTTCTCQWLEKILCTRHRLNDMRQRRALDFIIISSKFVLLFIYVSVYILRDQNRALDMLQLGHGS